ncbi:DNA/RNA nuclease SfsA [Magnetococcales bacterium HHB-1]
MQLPSPPIFATLLRRYKRFLADVQIDGEKDPITVHCPNPGSMQGLDQPGSRVRLSHDPDNKKRKYPYRLELISPLDHPEIWVDINTMRTNALVNEALHNNQFPYLGTIDAWRKEARFSGSRFDFLLKQKNQPDLFLEIKSVTLKTEQYARFPDAVTQRGTKHLKHLIQACQEGFRAALCFVIQRPDCHIFKPAKEIDPTYARQFCLAIEADVLCFAVQCAVHPDHVTLTTPIPLETCCP